tara:strand:- start:328 stop:615 length:288 start_codon:yes stop_codon:yes gene_type:complete
MYKVFTNTESRPKKEKAAAVLEQRTRHRREADIQRELYKKKYIEYLKADDQKKKELWDALRKQLTKVIKLGKEFGTEQLPAMKDLMREWDQEFTG